MTDSLINNYSEVTKEVTTATKNDKQFAMLSQNKYQFEHYLLEETNSVEINSDKVNEDINISGNDNETQQVVTAISHLSQFFNISEETKLISTRNKVVIQSLPYVSNKTEYKFIQTMYKLDLVLESIQQSKTHPVKNIGFNEEIQALTKHFIQKEQLETEYFRIVKDQSSYKLYLNFDETSISLDRLKQFIRNIEHQRKMSFNKVYVNREIVLDRDVKNTIKNQLHSDENKSQSINYKI